MEAISETFKISVSVLFRHAMFYLEELFRQATFCLAELFCHTTFYLVEQFCHATFYLVEQFCHATFYLVELVRQIPFPIKRRKVKWYIRDLLSFYSLKIIFIMFVIAPVMCILIYFCIVVCLTSLWKRWKPNSYWHRATVNTFSKRILFIRIKRVKFYAFKNNIIITEAQILNICRQAW